MPQHQNLWLSAPIAMLSVNNVQKQSNSNMRVYESNALSAEASSQNKV